MAGGSLRHAVCRHRCLAGLLVASSFALGLWRCPPGQQCLPLTGDPLAAGSSAAAHRAHRDAGWRSECYPWETSPTCEHGDATDAECRQSEVLSRMHGEYGVLWRPELDRSLQMELDGTVRVIVKNHGPCRVNCSTHLWATLTADTKGLRVVAAAHEVIQVNESVVALVFTVPQPGQFRLVIEQRFWHGDSVSSEAHDFRFVARNLDLATHQHMFGARHRSCGPKQNNCKEFARLINWQHLHQAWHEAGCLQLLDSPYDVSIVPPLSPFTTGEAGRLDSSGPGSSDVRACTLLDWEAPGYWVSPLPDYLQGNRSIFRGAGLPTTSAFEPLNCRWKGFNHSDLTTCLASVDKFYIIGDSLMRMKADKLREFGVPESKIEDHYKTKGGASAVPTSAQAMDNATGSATQFTVVMDDLGLVMDAWCVRNLPAIYIYHVTLLYEYNALIY